MISSSLPEDSLAWLKLATELSQTAIQTEKVCRGIPAGLATAKSVQSFRSEMSVMFAGSETAQAAGWLLIKASRRNQGHAGGKEKGLPTSQYH
jgi:hypothetical protein